MTGKWHVNQLPVASVCNHIGSVRKEVPMINQTAYNSPENQASCEKGWKPWGKNEGVFLNGDKHQREHLGVVPRLA